MKPETTHEVDSYYKKRISYTSQYEHFFFDVGHTLFSSFQIDDGSDLLLRLVEPPPDTPHPRALLDLGCGCGVLGIVLARRYPQARVVLADSDLLAVRYARHNSRINQTPNTEVIGSVGLENVPNQGYDLIVSNIPAKIGDAAIEQEFILGPLAYLRPGGVFWFVVVSGLNRLIPKIGVRHQVAMKEIKKRSGHAVYRIQKSEQG